MPDGKGDNHGLIDPPYSIRGINVPHCDAECRNVRTNSVEQTFISEDGSTISGSTNRNSVSMQKSQIRQGLKSDIVH